MLLDNQNCAVSVFQKTGGMDVREIERGLEKPGKSRIGLAKALNRSPSVVTEMLRPKGKRRQIKANEVAVIRQYLELEPGVPIRGLVGASGNDQASFYATGDDPQELAPPITGAGPDTVAVEIRGDSLGKAFNGWLAYYDARREPITEDLIGWLCVIEIDDGRVVAKIPRPARQAGRYHLMPNAGGEVIPDAKIVWAAKIIELRPKL